MILPCRTVEQVSQGGLRAPLKRAILHSLPILMKVLPLVFTLIAGWAAIRAMDTIAQIETTNPTPSLQAQQ